MAAHQAPLFLGFSRQECWNGVPLPSPSWMYIYLQMHQVVYIKYVHICVCQSHHNNFFFFKEQIEFHKHATDLGKTQNEIENLSILKHFAGLRKPEADLNI